MERTVFSEIQDQSLRLGLPEGFYNSLLDEDDWSFVIRANALVEAACTDALVAAFHAPHLRSSLASLELGHRKHGKVALLTKLGALQAGQKDVLVTLLELRNKLAHNADQVRFTFSAYLESLEPKPKKKFIDTAGYGLVPEGPDGVPRDQFVEKNPKFALWLTLAEILACLHLEHEVAKLRLSELAASLITPQANR